MQVDDHQAILSPGDRLGSYRIDSFLGQGGFGVTYVASDTMLDMQVAIKEYLPERIAHRAGDKTIQPRSEEHTEVFRKGLGNFLKEARTLARFKHPNIVRVMSIFELNNTAYMVMEYERGHDLKLLLDRRERVSEVALKSLFRPIIDGLEEVHRHGFIHRDIKPANILVREDGSPVLLDFGSARLATGQQTELMTAMVTAGFAPLEQYSGLDEQQGPWTDIYALGAVLYYAVRAVAPVDSTLRGAAVLNDKDDPLETLSSLKLQEYSAVFCRAVDWALQFKVSSRPQSLTQWRSRLFNDATTMNVDEAMLVAARAQHADKDIARADSASTTDQVDDSISTTAAGTDPTRAENQNGASTSPAAEPHNTEETIARTAEAKVPAADHTTVLVNPVTNADLLDSSAGLSVSDQPTQIIASSSSDLANLDKQDTFEPEPLDISDADANWDVSEFSSQRSKHRSKRQGAALDLPKPLLSGKRVLVGFSVIVVSALLALLTLQQPANDNDAPDNRLAEQIAAPNPSGDGSDSGALLSDSATPEIPFDDIRLAVTDRVRRIEDRNSRDIERASNRENDSGSSDIQSESLAQDRVADEELAEAPEQPTAEETARAEQLESDRQVQREEARRQAQLQREREEQAAAEAAREAAVVAREAARQERLAREAAEADAQRLAKQERNQFIEPPDSLIKPVISGTDMSDVLTRFNGLSNAIRQRDSEAVQRYTVASARKNAYFNYVFRTFDTVETRVTNISASRQDQTIRATLMINRLIRANGDIAIPPEEFRSIPIYSIKETQWSAIHW